MNTKKFTLVCFSFSILMSLNLSSEVQVDNTKPSEIKVDNTKPSKIKADDKKSDEKKVLSYKEKENLLKIFGYELAKQMPFGEEQGKIPLEKGLLNAFGDGFLLGLKGEKFSFTEDKKNEAQEFISQLMREFEEKNAEIRKKSMEERQKQNKDFLADLEKNNKNIKKTESGLYYEILKPGSDLRAKNDDIVTVNYEGSLIDGTVFDSSYESKVPATFQISNVIPGFAEGVKMLGIGGSGVFYILPNLAYGDNELPGIPASSLLKFRFELLDIKKSKK